ncbi:PIN2/TERF1-interacting telomerase inhibitor 1-like isoform X2 [Lytechinus variegatus]|nr:PIN2/TERF1-interacting telomerase inhibitor 1-like isoform X2 [Lytechinus variegatus]
MEKMGWSKGKGLGVKEDGNVSHVKVSLKNNNLGIGCKASQEDNWIAHQDDFNDLLSSLNEGHAPSTSNEREALSLEERSKKSRSRVHYKKFTRGKDMSRYGEDGMNSILGRRLTSSAPVTPQTQSVENSDDEEEKEKTHGIVTIKGSCSVGEYFAQKMSALKKAKRRQESESHSDTELEVPRCGFGFRDSAEQGQRSDVDVAGPSGLLDGGNEEEEEQEEEESEEGQDGQRNRSKKKKKKRKKKARAAARDSDEENGEQIEVRGESDIEEDEGIDLGRKKKKNKKKRRLVDESKSESASEHNENGDKKKKKKTKKSKKDKNRHSETPDCSHDDDTAENSEERSSGETSKRKRESSEEGLEDERGETSSGKKKRKRNYQEDEEDCGEGPSTSAKKKKKKKHKV